MIESKINWSYADTQNTIQQMEQVKFTCKLEAFQEDAIGAVIIDEDDLIADPVFNFDFKDLVELVYWPYDRIDVGQELNIGRAKFRNVSNF